MSRRGSLMDKMLAVQVWVPVLQFPETTQKLCVSAQACDRELIMK